MWSFSASWSRYFNVTFDPTASAYRRGDLAPRAQWEVRLLVSHLAPFQEGFANALARVALRRLLRAELRETLRTLETPAAEASRIVRAWRRAMHAARIGQLYRELARPTRGLLVGVELHQALETRKFACA